MIPRILEEMEKNPKICGYFSFSSHPQILAHLARNLDKINWSELSQNESSEAVEILKNNKDKIVWRDFSKNSNPEAVKLLKMQKEKIDWNYACENKNPEIVDLLRARQDFIDWKKLSENPAIFRATRNEEIFKALMEL